MPKFRPKWSLKVETWLLLKLIHNEWEICANRIEKAGVELGQAYVKLLVMIDIEVDVGVEL